MNIGVFGGTFDPPHIGHLIAAQDACVALSLDRLLFVPAAEPPHKKALALTSAELRLEMLRAAIGGNRLFEISTVELERTGPSYTVDTLRALSKNQPGDTLFLLIGVDQVKEFGKWREPDEISRLAQVAMLTRAGEAPGEQAGFLRATVGVTRVDVSSTLIRKRVAAGQPIDYLVPASVAEIIQREGLYSGIC